jgi:hypothetical protein
MDTANCWYQYIKARKPELYREILAKEHQLEQKIIWLKENGKRYFFYIGLNIAYFWRFSPL